MRLSKPNLILAALASLAAGGIGLAPALAPAPAPIWPSADGAFRFWPYSDEEKGGGSRVLAFSGGEGDGIVAAAFSLGREGKWPRYAGLSLTPTRASALRSLFQRDGSLLVRYRARGGSQFAVLVQTEVEGYTEAGSVDSRRFSYAYLPPTEDWAEIRLPFASFRTPDWWFEAHPGSGADPRSEGLAKTLGLDLVVAGAAPAGVPQAIEVASIRVEPSRAVRAWALALLPLPALTLARGRARGWARGAGRAAPPPERPRWSSLEVGDKEEADARSIAELIGRIYPEGGLSLARVAGELGIAEERVSRCLESLTGLKFKPYLNAVRVGEASRLLLESDRTVTEIAYLVGYSSLGHFNRVFKETTGIAPMAFRKRGRARTEGRESAGGEKMGLPRENAKESPRKGGA